MPLPILSTFARGVLAPGLHSRVDTSAYHSALATARNVIIFATGGAGNRPGRQFIGPAKFHDKTARLIPFSFNNNDTYALEFGDFYMRVVRNDAHVLDTSGISTITGITNANPAVVTTSAPHGLVNGETVFIGGVTGMAEVNGRYFLVANVAASTFELTDQFTGLPLNSTSFGTYISGGSSGVIFEIVTPYAEADLALIKYAQSGDVMTLVHPSYDIRELQRFDHDNWVLVKQTFLPAQAGPTNVAGVQNGAAGSTVYKYKITAASKEGEEESLAGPRAASFSVTGVTQANPAVVTTSAAHGYANGDEVLVTGIVGMTELNGRVFIARGVTGTTFQLEDEDSTEHATYASGGTVQLTHATISNGNATLTAANNINLTWVAAAGAVRYTVYKESQSLYGKLGETEGVAFVDDGTKTADFSISPPKPRNPFMGPNKRPAAIGLYEQRRVAGGSNSKPDTSFFSQTGGRNNMSVSSPVQATDAITAQLTAQEKNRIEHYISLNDLLVLTSGQEWLVNSGDNVGFAPDTIRQKPQSQWGAGSQRPVIVGSTVLFVENNGRVVRSLGFSLDIDGYTGNDMSVLASHLFEHEGIASTAYARGPSPLYAALREDGLVAVLTFKQEQQVIAWALWDTPGGEDESVAGLQPSALEKDETLYFIVRRKRNGADVRYIEKLHSRIFRDVEDAFFVDSGVTRDDPKEIENVTAANPAVVTVIAHGFANGTEIDISGITWASTEDAFGNEVQPDQLNSRRYRVASATTDTFQLEDVETGTIVDGSGFAAFVDDGIVRATFSTVPFLWHLEGKTVVALADGNVVKNLVVANGQVILPRNTSRAHVGLAYTSDVETLNLEPIGSSGTLQGRRLHVPYVTVRFNRSRGLWIGPNKNDLDEMQQREFEKYGQPTQLLTGDKTIVIPPTWDSNGRLFMRQRDPLPMEILGVIPRVEVSDD